MQSVEKDKESLKVHRLELLGLDNKSPAQQQLNSFKTIDQMQNRDLFVNVTVKSGLDQQLTNMTTYQKQRAHHLPLGGMMGERIAKSMTFYNDQSYNSTEPDLDSSLIMENNHKSSASAIRREARMSLDMGSKAKLSSMKLDARRTSMEQLPQRSSIFRMTKDANVGPQAFEKHKNDPMARTQMSFGALSPNADFGSIQIQSRPLIPQKKKLQMHDFGHKKTDQRAIPTKAKVQSFELCVQK